MNAASCRSASRPVTKFSPTLFFAVFRFALVFLLSLPVFARFLAVFFMRVH
jgi:hypothetical protein